MRELIINILIFIVLFVLLCIIEDVIIGHFKKKKAEKYIPNGNYANSVLDSKSSFDTSFEGYYSYNRV